MPRRIIAREIAEAICDGFNAAQAKDVATLGRDGWTFLVYVDGFAEPIRVRRSEVTLPEWARPLAPSIRLDAQAVLA